MRACLCLFVPGFKRRPPHIESVHPAHKHNEKNTHIWSATQELDTKKPMIHSQPYHCFSPSTFACKFIKGSPTQLLWSPFVFTWLPFITFGRWLREGDVRTVGVRPTTACQSKIS